MYKGMFLKKTTIPEKIKEALWWEEQCVRREGGYDFDSSNLPDDAKWLPKGTVLKFVKETGKACVVKSTRVKENANKSATTLKIEKDSYFKVGDTIAGVTISNIVKGIQTWYKRLPLKHLYIVPFEYKNSICSFRRTDPVKEDTKSSTTSCSSQVNL